MANPNYDQRAEAIYAAAKKQDEPALLVACRETGLNISRKVNNISMCPITQAAYEGDRKALAFLLRFGGSIHDAVMGAAIRGDEDLVKTLLAAGANLTMAVRGFAIGNHVTQVNEILLRKAQGKSVANYYALIGSALAGYSIAPNVGQINKWLTAIKNPKVTEHNTVYTFDYKDFPTLSYAQSGLVELVNESLKQGASLESAIKGYISGGYIQEANACLEKALQEATTEEEKIELKTLAAKMYALDGYTDQVNDLIKKGADVLDVLECYVLVDNYSDVEALLKKPENIKQIKHRHGLDEEYVRSHRLRNSGKKPSRVELDKRQQELVHTLELYAAVDFTGKELTAIKQEIKRQFQPMLPRKDWVRFFQIKPYGVASAMLLDEIEKSKNIEELKQALTNARDHGRSKNYSLGNPFMQAVNKMLGGVDAMPKTTPELNAGR